MAPRVVGTRSPDELPPKLGPQPPQQEPASSQFSGRQVFFRIVLAPFRFVLGTVGLLVGGSLLIVAALLVVLAMGGAASAVVVGAGSIVVYLLLCFIGIILLVLAVVVGVIAMLLVGLGFASIFVLLALLVFGTIDAMAGTRMMKSAVTETKAKVKATFRS